ncbi:antichymotrypsin-2-like isoform X2 [Trichoplusia ni]|uniref:Antichymotrypsin-2-like isoform X2 n=1 Tax=Trichoplusia ni TaxID=7111 RepID=A0A7E5VNI0_TRINI|nr:antichymotrypsin-2-like isoform X2 [Trichoplusia ni]
MWRALVVLAVTANNFLTTTSQTTTSIPTPPSPNDTCVANAVEALVLGNLDFTPKVLDSLRQRNDGDVFVGGVAILFMMSQLALYASNAASQQILNAMRFNDTEQIRCLFAAFGGGPKRRAREVDLNLYTFSKIYAGNDYPLTTQAQDEIQELFDVGPENVDFNAPGSAEKINDEVARNMNNTVVDFIEPEILPYFDSLLMLDAFYLKGEWLKPFNYKDTQFRYFFGANNIVRKPTMYQRGTFLYYDSEKLGCQIMKLLYKADPDFKVAFLLPRSTHGLPDLINRLKNGDDAAEAFYALREQEIDVYIPKFDVTMANQLKIPTQDAGINLIFNNATAGLESIVTCNQPYVSEILQQLTYQIDETGVGSITGIAVSSQQTSQSSHHVPVFRANRPFVYYLFYKRLLLAAGTVTY